MVVQPRVTTTVEGTRFAVLYVTPERPIVELTNVSFYDLDQFTAPKVMTWTVKVPDEAVGTRCAAHDVGFSCGGGYRSYEPDAAMWTPPTLGDGGLGDGGLVEETIGPYQFVRAQPTSTAELAGWLDQLGYAYMPADLDAAAPYIALGYHVVALRVSIAQPLQAPMTPIALTWPGTELRVPAALGRGSAIATKFTVYIAADGEYVFGGASIGFAGYANSGDAPYLTKNVLLLDQSLPPAQDPVAVSVPSIDYEDITVIREEVHVPVTVDCDDGGCCNDCSAKPRTRLDWITLVVVVGYVLRRRRR
jgi:hypothetical protein